MCVKVIDLTHLTHDNHGAGTAERFNKALGIVVDAEGTIVVADIHNHQLL